jgi:DNA-binding transcriptional LysR family regulator
LGAAATSLAPLIDDELKMHLTHIHRSDLNLLPALAVLLEERRISKAAAQHNLSQPAMSRLLRRVREIFGDEFLIRTVRGYELTARARRLQEEPQSVLPEVDRMLRGDVFNPAIAEDTFRVCGTDSLSILIALRLPRRLKCIAPNVQLELVAWHDKALEDISHDRVDVLLWANQVPAPASRSSRYSCASPQVAGYLPLHEGGHALAIDCSRLLG